MSDEINEEKKLYKAYSKLEDVGDFYRSGRDRAMGGGAMTLRERIERLLLQWAEQKVKADRSAATADRGGWHSGCASVLGEVVFELSEALKKDEQEGGA